MTKDQQPLTLADLRQELAQALKDLPTKSELSDRFEHYDQRQDTRHREMMHGIAEAIERVNDHTTTELAQLRHDLEIRQEFDHLAAKLAERLGVSVAELTGRRA